MLNYPTTVCATQGHSTNPVQTHPAYRGLAPEYLPYITPYGHGDDLELDFDYEAFQAAQATSGYGGNPIPPIQHSPSPSPDSYDNSRDDLGDLPAGEEEAAEYEKEVNTEATSCKKRGRKPRTMYTAAEHEALARTAVDLNPWGALYGQKRKAWEEVLKALQSQGMFVDASVGTIRNKMEAMIAWQADPDSPQGRIINELTESTKHALASVLDRASELKATAELATEEEKAKAKQKAEEDRIGGEAIRSASLAAFRRKRKLTDRAEDDTECDSDTENVRPDPPIKRSRLAKSASSTDTSFELRENSRQLIDVLVAGQKRQEEFQKQLMSQMQETTNRCLQVLERLTNALTEGLTRSDRFQ